MECSCCGGDAGRFSQWWNRDTGYGICANCVARMRARGVDEEEIKFGYGVEGLHFEAAPMLSGVEIAFNGRSA